MTNSSEIVEKNKKYSLFTWATQSQVDPLCMVKGEGIFIWDVSGKKYYDMRADQASCNVGKQHPKVIAAMKNQIDQLTAGAPQYASEAKGEISEKLVKKLGDHFGKIFYTNGGADAVENAVKMARLYTGRQKVISRYYSYHGSTAGAGALTGDPRRWACEPAVPGALKAFPHYCYRCPFGKEEGKCKLECATHIEDIVRYENPDNIAAIICETVVGANGFLVPPEGYLPKVREICDKYGIVMILDEVMAGFGRTGSFFAFQQFDVTPDIVTMAKGLTSGYVPMGAVGVCKDISDFFENRHLPAGLTYSGHILGCATACACVDVIDEENLCQNARVQGEYINKCLRKLAEKHLCMANIHGIGLMQCFELVYDRETKEPMNAYGESGGIAGKLLGYLTTKGMLIGDHDNFITIAPPLVVKKEHIDSFMDILDMGLTECCDPFYKGGKNSL